MGKSMHFDEGKLIKLQISTITVFGQDPNISPRWWQLKYFLFSSRKLGEKIPILTSIFLYVFDKGGWFNHQLGSPKWMVYNGKPY